MRYPATFQFHPPLATLWRRIVDAWLIRPVAWARYQAQTAILFTWTDYKTIFFPITAFACATAPLNSFQDLLRGWVWIWLHLLLCNVSNQARSGREDAVLRPWRPVPAGRITCPQAIVLRWILVAICITLSAAYAEEVVLMTLYLTLTTYLYDEMDLAGHVIGKNLCNIGGYTAFEIGATKIFGGTSHLDSVAKNATLLSGLLIFTTIQTQDFPDVEGDAAAGRVTFPIYAPEFSRAFTLIALITWSMYLSWFWGIGYIGGSFFTALGMYVGLQYYLCRSLAADKRSYIIYNIWLVLAHILPFSARIHSKV
ncbi:hypothetical protein OBBRIDRAFT_737651 [Obba rivulosa]|uniref:Uncharacterized protein n=1 Tax=Obba rivulosa TaxID=1052685 RepID=A0A8E2DH56_9APHY|nr:hypothetical protein OBBRIDRAFT_737651 [Obba rivulosa]